METQTPSRPVKAKRTRLEPLPAPELVDDELDPITQQPANKYAKRIKIGRPNIGRSPNYVETIGLGNLRVITTNGVQSELRSEPGS